MNRRLAIRRCFQAGRRFLRAGRTAEAGFTLLEVLISTALIVIIIGVVFQLLHPSTGAFQAQPEVSDMQQRLRVAADLVQKDLVMAGAGPYSGFLVGSLDNYFAPILPHRVGIITPDAPGSFRANALCQQTCASAVTVMYVPTTAAQTTLGSDMSTPSAALTVNRQPGCPSHDELCGFKPGMRVLVVTPSGAYDVFTVTNVETSTLQLQPRDGTFTAMYPAGSWITAIESHTYYLNQNVAANTYELRHYDGYQTDLPVIDNVVDFRVEFFGDPLPPQIVRPVADAVGPWTTYGPKPPAIGQDNTDDPWAAGENCVFHIDASSGRQVARPQIQTLGTALDGPVQLSRAQLTDGPWCPSEVSTLGDAMPNRFDADLLRVRQVRVTLRVQVASELLRGPAGPLFRVGGRSTGGQRFVPDQEVRFDVSPRNVNLGR